MSEQPSPGYRPQQPQQPMMGKVAWSQVTNYLQQQNSVLIFMAIIAALFIAYNLAESKNKDAHTSRQRNVPPKPEEGERQP